MFANIITLSLREQWGHLHLLLSLPTVYFLNSLPPRHKSWGRTCKYAEMLMFLYIFFHFRKISQRYHTIMQMQHACTWMWRTDAYFIDGECTVNEFKKIHSNWGWTEFNCSFHLNSGALKFKLICRQNGINNAK